MHFFKCTVLISTAIASALALPTTTGNAKALDKRALEDRPYSEIQISDGVAGNAAEEAQAKFPVDPATASSEDLQVVKRASQLNGFIKNKVLKNYLGLLALQIQQAQGADVANLETRLAGEQTKLDKNTATDRQHAGEASKGVQFDG
ncbi:small secreted protein [Paramyrothecium foliicola]|nr:small secreted protein [Paramyrothecium foliicola]